MLRRRYRRPSRYSTRSKVRRSYRRRPYNYKKKNWRGIRRGRIAINARPVTTKSLSVPYALYVESIADPAVKPIYWMYISFAPCQNETLQPDPMLVIQNSAVTEYNLGTLCSDDAWTTVYAKTKLKKVVVNYYPGITQGMSGAIAGLALDAVFHTIPIYDNVDDVINENGNLAAPATIDYTPKDLQDVLRKPYARTHSIYKPMKRVLVPKQFMKQSGYGGAENYYKKGSYHDLSNTEVKLHGLLIGMPAMSAAGFNTGGTLLPVVEEDCRLGKLMFTYYQSFKTRT